MRKFIRHFYVSIRLHNELCCKKSQVNDTRAGEGVISAKVWFTRSFIVCVGGIGDASLWEVPSPKVKEEGKDGKGNWDAVNGGVVVVIET